MDPLTVILISIICAGAGFVAGVYVESVRVKPNEVAVDAGEWAQAKADFKAGQLKLAAAEAAKAFNDGLKLATSKADLPPPAVPAAPAVPAVLPPPTGS